MQMFLSFNMKTLTDTYLSKFSAFFSSNFAERNLFTPVGIAFTKCCPLPICPDSLLLIDFLFRAMDIFLFSG